MRLIEEITIDSPDGGSSSSDGEGIGIPYASIPDCQLSIVSPACTLVGCDPRVHSGKPKSDEPAASSVSQQNPHAVEQTVHALLWQPSHETTGTSNQDNQLPGSQPSQRRKRRRYTVPIDSTFNTATDESGITTYICKTCQQQFNTLGSARKHESEHSEDRPFVCDHCPRTYISAAQLRNHVKIHEDASYRFECEFCGYCTTSEASLDIHKRRHAEGFLAHCEECGKGYRSETGLDAHINRDHRGTTPYKCFVCIESFVSRVYLYSHMRNAHPRSEYYICDVCGKRMTGLGHLRRHKEGHDNKPTSYLCDFCGKSLTSQSSLTEHRRIHTGEKPFMCPHCGKTFSKTTTLKIHVRTHTGERPYQCKVCGKTFTQPTPRRIHMRSHTGERPYKCDICHEGYVSRTALNSHLEVHRRTGNAKPVRKKSQVAKTEDANIDFEIPFGDVECSSTVKNEPF